MKKVFSPKSIFLAIGLLAAASAQTSRADLVYNNGQNDTTNVFVPGSFEVGNQIILGGTARYVTNFTLQFYASGLSANATVEIRFYLNDGSPVDGSSSPGTLIWDSGAYAAVVNTAGATLSYALPDVLVPDQFTWTVQFSDYGTGTVGLPIYTPPVLGSTYNDYWQNDGTGWQLYTNATTPMSFAVTIDAVPEPSTIALCLIGAAGFLAVRRRR